MTKSAAHIFLVTSVLLLTGGFPLKSGAQVFINEVCTYNGNVLEDEDGDEPDWIELYNAGSSAVNLLDYVLYGGSSEPWKFPAVAVPPQGYLIVFASGKNRTGPFLHTHFKLSKSGETVRLFDASGLPQDELTTTELHLDHAYGRSPDGGNATGLFQIPTPGTTNQASTLYNGYASDPQFSLNAGFYNGSCNLEITAMVPGQVHYTVDGSEPLITSPLCTGPLTISTTTVVKARAFSALSIELPSRVITNTYFINYSQMLPVFSISTAPENFFDWNTGIYVSGPNASPVYPYYGSNFWEDWEIGARIEFFEADGDRIFSQDAGVSIHGGTANRTKPMKSLRLTNRNKYGSDAFEHRFFSDRSNNTFKTIVLRNSSGDFNKTHFRDGSLHKLMMGRVDVDLMAYRPSAVFINGVYWGVHNIRERISKNYLEENFGVDGDNIDLLEEDSLVLEGDFTAFNAMHAYVTGNDMSVQSHYDSAARMIDLHSLCDYYIAETFLSNIDWPYNNIKFWRERKAGAKWRYILIDLDIALNNNGWAPSDFDILGRILGPYGDNNRHVQIFKQLLHNGDFREYFINRYADLVNTLFSSANMEAHILQVREVLAGEMPNHFNKWGNSVQGWDQEIFQVVMPHIYHRPAFAMQQVMDTFRLSGINNLELDVWPPAAGSIRINTITPGPLPWKGDYFHGNPVTITVVPNDGYSFVRWDSDHITLEDPLSMQLRMDPVEPNRLIAYFSTTSDPSQLMVYPNPANHQIQVGFLMITPGNGHMEILNALGQPVFKKIPLQLNEGLNKHELDVTQLSPGVYTLAVRSDEGVKSARLVIY